MDMKSLAVTVSALVLSTSINAEILSVTYGYSTGHYGDDQAIYNPDSSPFNGYVIGMGAGENGTDSAISGFNSFDSSFGQLVNVSLSYQFTHAGTLSSGAFSERRVSGVTAVSSHQGIVNYGFDGVFTTQIENSIVTNNISVQQPTPYSSIPVAWNSTKLWNGYYAIDNSQTYGANWEQNYITFDGSLFDEFINKSFQLEVLSTTFGSSITGCNSLSTCALNARSDTFLANARLTYTYDDGVSAVPVPAAVWLFSSGLIGLIGMARRKV